MAETNLSQIMELKTKSLGELKAKYEELFLGQKAPSNNKVFLWRKIAYRIQEIEHGGVSDGTQDKIQQSSNNTTQSITKLYGLMPTMKTDLRNQTLAETKDYQSPAQ